MRVAVLRNFFDKALTRGQFATKLFEPACRTTHQVRRAKARRYIEAEVAMNWPQLLPKIVGGGPAAKPQTL